MYLDVRRGLNTRGGKGVKPGWLLKARNSRYLPGDSQQRLWALLGRSLFGTVPDNIDAIFPFYIDGGASYICAHAGSAIYEAVLGIVGTFSSALSLGGDAERGHPFSYLRNTYYPAGPDVTNGFWTREPAGWVKGGHRTPTATFTAANQGSGSFASTTDVVYTYRIYDNTTGTESAHGPTVTKALFNTVASVRLTFAAGVTINGERGTHLRIYRSLLSEPAGKLYRVDGSGDGIALALVTAGYTFDDSTSNVNALIYGLVQSDGEETTLAWAEYGGPPPKARGGMIFNDHAVLWGIDADDPELPLGVNSEGIIMYSAQGLPELYPVDFDGVYQYYLTFSTSKQDKVQLCCPAGPYMLVLNQNSIFRVLSLPTYQDAGFNRKVQDVLTTDHGCCGEEAADSFGIGTEESSYCVYVSREHGPMLTNGVSDRPIVDQANWLQIANKDALDQVVVRNYQTAQECWIFLPLAGSTTNNAALIVNYANAQEAGLRVTGPVDVKCNDAFLGWTPSGRFYLASNASGNVYIQDNGSVDAQANTNAAGDIVLEWSLPFVRLAKDVFRTAEASRLAVEGMSGTAKTFNVEIITTDGVEEYSETDTVQIGPGETDDSATAAVSGNSHRAALTYQGATGSTYDDEAADCAPCIQGITWEIAAIGRQKRMSGT